MKQPLNFLYTEKKLNKIFFSEHGMALIMTLVFVTLLSGWALSLNKNVRNTLDDTFILKNSFILYNRAKSGIAIAEEILVKDRESSETDSVQEFWADPVKIKTVLSGLGYSSNELNIEITDVLSKIQINALVEFPNNKNGSQVKLWERFLDGLKAEFPELIKNPYDIINPLIDWLDFGDDDAITGLTGAEKSYYETEGKHYVSRNGPMKSVNELSCVKGISEKLWNNVSISGIAHEYLTTDGAVTRSGNTFRYSGKININTAPNAVIAALIKDKSFLHMADEIVEWREDKSEGHFLHELDGNWYKTCPSCEEVPLDESLITTSSQIFCIRSVAVNKDYKVVIEAVVERVKDKKGKWSCRVLKWITS